MDNNNVEKLIELIKENPEIAKAIKSSLENPHVKPHTPEQLEVINNVFLGIVVVTCVGFIWYRIATTHPTECKCRICHNERVKKNEESYINSNNTGHGRGGMPMPIAMCVML